MMGLVGYLVNLLVGAVIGAGLTTWYVRKRIGPLVAQGMWDAISELSLQEATQAFVKQRKVPACAMVLAQREGMVVSVAVTPTFTQEQEQRFEEAAAACLEGYRQHKLRMRTNQQSKVH